MLYLLTLQSTRKHSIALILLIVGCTLGKAQNYSLSGTVSDSETLETILGATVSVPQLGIGTVTNEYGFYSISLPEGTHIIKVSYMGYQTLTDTINVSKDRTINYVLQEDLNQLDEIVIKQDIEINNLSDPQMSNTKLTAKTIKTIPAVLGEPDVLRSLTLLPGVSNAGEAASGFNVRGGGADQNLILLDEAIIFNSSHLFGFFSVFNNDAVKSIDLYKGGIPARYGGRLSSVLDIHQRDGNKNDFAVNGGIGLLSSKLLIEGPIQKEKASFLLAGRTSYAHWFLRASGEENVASFYDLNTKVSYRIDENNTLYLSGYFGRDNLSFGDDFTNTYGNALVNLRWNHIFSNKLFSNMSLIYSDYNYNLDIDFSGFEWTTNISNLNLKYDFLHYLDNDMKLRYGVNNIYYRFQPGKIEPTSSASGITAEEFEEKHANELALYAEAEHKINDKLYFNYGLRWSSFSRLGQNDIAIYDDNGPVIFNDTFQIYQAATPIGTESFSRGKVIEHFHNLEPRASVSYLYNDNTSFKLSYNRMTQYLHLLTNTNAPTPLDLWTPSGQFIKPQKLDQFAIGFYKNINDSKYTIEAESFFKQIKNRIDFIDGANLIANENIEQTILNGEARSYGLELLLKKNTGSLRGWVACTLSRSEQRTPGRNSLEPGINKGNWYATAYDRTHDFSAFASYMLNDQWSLSSNFIFQTGLPTNLPIGQIRQLGLIIPIYGDRNSSRLSNYHRLDISATYTPKQKESKKWSSEWVFGIYNIYNRRNAASYSFRQNRETGNNEAIRTSIFGMVPAISYNFKF